MLPPAQLKDSGLAYLRHQRGIVTLSLAGCVGITDAGLAHLAGKLRLALTSICPRGRLLNVGCLGSLRCEAGSPGKTSSIRGHGFPSGSSCDAHAFCDLQPILSCVP